MPQKLRHSASHRTLSPVNLIPGSLREVWGLLKRKENSSQGLRRRLEVRLRCRTFLVKYPSSGAGILTCFPFDSRRRLASQVMSLLCNGVTLSLRID